MACLFDGCKAASPQAHLRSWALDAECRENVKECWQCCWSGGGDGKIWTWWIQISFVKAKQTWQRFWYLAFHGSWCNPSLDYDAAEFISKFNNELGNAFGNLVSRLRKPAFFPNTSLNVTDQVLQDELCVDVPRLMGKLKKGYATWHLPLFVELVGRSYEEGRFHVALERLVAFLHNINARINQVQPWRSPQDRSEELESAMVPIIVSLRAVITLLHPVMPHICARLMAEFGVDLNHFEGLTSITKTGSICMQDFLNGSTTPLFPKIAQPCIQPGIKIRYQYPVVSTFQGCDHEGTLKH